MRTIATLGPSVRLVVFQFLMKSAQVPAGIPLKGESATPPMPAVKGVEVLNSTPKLCIFPFVIRVACHTDYELVDVWQKPHETNWNMSFVRFVFCRNEHIKRDELFPDFVAKRSTLTEVFAALTDKNLWATHAYLNPYFEKNDTDSGHQVLMLGCAGRVPNDRVFSGGRDEYNRGIGPKVPLSTLCSKLTLMTENDVVLVALEPIPETVSSPVA